MPLAKNLRLLSWFNFCSELVFFSPVAIIYFTKLTGSMALGMSVFSVAYVSAAALEVPTGIFSDLIGRKKTIISGAFFSVVCMVIYALSQSYFPLLVGAFFQGLSRAFFSGNNEALLHDYLSESNQKKEFANFLGKTSAMFQIALAIAAGLGSILAAVSYSLVMWLSVIPQIVALFLATQLSEPQKYCAAQPGNIYRHLKQAAKNFWQNSRLKLITLSSVIHFAFGEASFFFRSTFINSLWPLWAVGWAQMTANLLGALSFYSSGRFIKKFHCLKILKFGVIFNRLVILIGIIFPSVVSPLLMATSSATFGWTTVATSTLLQQEFSPVERATMGSLNSLFGNLAFGVIAVVLGIIADHTSPAIALIMAQLILFTPWWLYHRLEKPKTEPNS